VGLPPDPLGVLRAARSAGPETPEGGDVRRRSDPLAEPTDRPTTGRSRAATTGHRSSLPWVSVVAGAGAVTLVVAVAGMVGAVTGGGEAVVVSGNATEGLAETESGVPSVTPRRDEPRPTVTRIPPPGTTADGTEDDRATDEADGGGAAAPVPGPAAAPSVPSAPPTVAPAPAAPSSPTTPAPDPSPTDEPTDDTDEESVTWVQERLLAHGATVDVTGVLDEATVAALRAFQESHGLTVTGSVTAETGAALAAAPGSGGEESGEDPGGTVPVEPTPSPTPDQPSVAPGSTSTTTPATGITPVE
jgi:hypothetical protein